MLSAVMYEKQDIRLINRNVPEITENEILVKVKCAGICGTDLRIYQNGIPNVTKHTPRTLGHEFSGVIEKVGKNIRHYKVGMRVSVAPNIGCGVCDTCVEGNEHLCDQYEAIGIHLDGGFAEYVRIPESAVRSGNVVEIPDHVSFEEAMIVEPLSCVYNGIQKSNVHLGDTVLIIGAGPIGIMHAMFAKLAGAAKVFITNRSERRLEIVEQVDPSFITVPSKNLEADIHRLTNGQGVDVCIAACSDPGAQTLAVQLVKLNGRVNFFGGLPKDNEMIKMNGNLIHYKQIVVTGTTRSSSGHFRKTLGLIAAGQLKVDPLITDRYSIQEFDQALEKAINRTGLKTIITFE